MKDNKKILEQIRKAEETKHDSKWSEESYESGVIAALNWVMENTHMPPMEELTADEIKKIMKT